jgi:hypothetical protein
MFFYSPNRKEAADVISAAIPLHLVSIPEILTVLNREYLA